ncbi:MAG: hypothetical protein ACK5TO_04540, partial [Planctomycetaceae bacterium]
MMTSFSTFGVFHSETRTLLEACDRTYQRLRSDMSGASSSHLPARLPVEIYLAMEPDLQHIARILGQDV